MNSEHQLPVERLWILLGKKKSGEASTEELRELEHLLQQQYLSESSLDIIDNLWEQPISSIPHVENSDSIWEQVQEKITRQRKDAPVFYLYKKWIAAVAVVFIMGFFYFLFKQKEGTLVRSPAVAQSEISTAPHTKQKLQLPDGTTVWLNGNSQLHFNKEKFGKREREVSLTGEAFFDVVKNEKVPFIIHTGNINIKVKGTAFNVKAYPDAKAIETALVRGLIEITTQSDPERRILLKPNEKIIIPAEEKQPNSLHKNTDTILTQSLYSIVKLDSREPEKIAETSWLKTSLQFDNETFEELAPKLESWYTVNIQFEDEAIKKKRFSGTIEKETVQQTLEAMSISNPFRFTIKDYNILITKKP